MVYSNGGREELEFKYKKNNNNKETRAEKNKMRESMVTIIDAS